MSRTAVVFRFALVLSAFAFVTLAFDPNANVRSHSKVVTCYVASWAAYRPNKGAFTWENIDPMQCTHIIYSFAGINNETFTIHSMDPFLDTSDFGGKNQYRKIQGFKEQNPKLKVTLAVGGWNEGSGKYSNMSATPETRKAFIDSVVAFIKKHGFDGLDMDWEYPGVRAGSRVEDRETFAQLLKEMRTEFDKNGYLLTAAVGASLVTINKAYDVPAISQSLDYIHIMGYDYHGSWDAQTGHNAPLRLANTSSSLAPELRLSVDDTVKYLMEKGAPRNKLVLGVPFYGRTFVLQDENVRHKGAMSKGTGFQGPYTREDGFLGFNEICKELLPSADTGPWTVEWDDVAAAPFMYKDNRWVSFDNQRSIAIKTRYSFDERLAGVMVWAIDNDDFAGECSNDRYPLLRTINSELKKATEEAEVPAVVVPVTTEAPGSKSTATGLPGAHLLLLLTTVIISSLFH